MWHRARVYGGQSFASSSPSGMIVYVTVPLSPNFIRCSCERVIKHATKNKEFERHHDLKKTHVHGVYHKETHTTTHDHTRTMPSVTIYQMNGRKDTIRLRKGSISQQVIRLLLVDQGVGLALVGFDAMDRGSEPRFGWWELYLGVRLIWEVPHLYLGGSTRVSRGGAAVMVDDGGGVLLRRQVRREGAVRFPVESSALQREIPPPRVPFRENDPNTTPRKPLTVPAPFTRTGRNSSSASTRFPRCTRSSLARRPPSPRRTKSPPPWCRYASLPDSPLPKSRRMSCFAHSSLPPVCLTPSPSSAASREKASHGELAESRGDQETLPGVHLESRREPGAP